MYTNLEEQCLSVYVIAHTSVRSLSITSSMQYAHMYVAKPTFPSHKKRQASSQEFLKAVHACT